MRIIRYDALIEAPWKNGGGVTRDVASDSVDDDPIWRLSIADVKQDGPFSNFAGMVRILTVINGHGMALESKQGTIDARGWTPVRFDGALNIYGHLTSGPLTNLNLMFNPDYCDGNVAVLQGPHQQSLKPGSNRVLSAFCLSGTLDLNADIVLYPGDTAMVDTHDCEMTLKAGDAALLVTIDLINLSD